MSADATTVELTDETHAIVRIPTSGHGVAVLGPALTGGTLAICCCSEFAVIVDDADEAAALLDAHIAEAGA